MDLTVTEGTAPREGFFLVEIDRFQGPMDLLLHLIRTQDIDVFDIPIAKITDQFLQAIRGIQAHDLDSAGEFLEMAATLIRIKAQMLLPRTSEEEDEDPRAELVRRLLEYEQIREVSQRLSAAEANRARRFGKGFLAPRPRRPMAETPLETTWDEVFQVALNVELPEPHQRQHRVTPRTVSMEDKVVLILDTLRASTRVEFSRLLADFQEKMHGVMTFLAGLELTRRRLLFLRQTQPFAELWIYRRDEEEEGEGPVEDASLQEPEPEPEGEGPRRPKRPSWMKPEEPEEPMPDVLAALGLDEEEAPTAADPPVVPAPPVLADEEADEQDAEAPEAPHDDDPDEEPVNRADEGAAPA